MDQFRLDFKLNFSFLKNQNKYNYIFFYKYYTHPINYINHTNYSNYLDSNIDYTDVS